MQEQTVLNQSQRGYSEDWTGEREYKNIAKKHKMQVWPKLIWVKLLMDEIQSFVAGQGIKKPLRHEGKRGSRYKTLSI